VALCRNLKRKTATLVPAPTGISFPNHRTFEAKSSEEPFHKDGTAISSYSDDRGVITLYLGDHSLEGFSWQERLRACPPRQLRSGHAKMYAEDGSEILSP